MTITGAFSTGQVARLTGLSKRQIEYWDETNVFHPSLRSGGYHRPYGRIYSFQDVVALRTLAKLRKRVALDKLRKLGLWLKEQYDHPWSSLRFYLTPSNEIAFDDPISDELVTTRPVRQGALPIELEPIAAQIDRRFARMRDSRDRREIGVITRNRYIQRNEWIIAGTRIPVWVIQELAESGYSCESLLETYPMLRAADIDAALTFDIGAPGDADQQTA